MRQSNCEGDDGVMRNGRAVDWDNPLWVMGIKVREFDWDPIRGLHQGQRSCAAQTGRTHDLHPTASKTSDSSCNAGVVHT